MVKIPSEGSPKGYPPKGYYRPAKANTLSLQRCFSGKWNILASG